MYIYINIRRKEQTYIYIYIQRKKQIQKFTHECQTKSPFTRTGHD